MSYIFVLFVLLPATLVTSLPLEGDDQKHEDKRIINGNVADPGSHPYIVTIQMKAHILCEQHGVACDELPNKYIHVCGGSVIGGSWVLTAAHCLADLGESHFLGLRVVLGEHHLLDNSTTEVHRGVQDIIIHPEYDTNLVSNDIALIKLSYPVAETHHIRFASLSHDDSEFCNNTCVFSGWGEGSGKVLNEVKLELLPFDECWVENKIWLLKENYQEIKELFPHSLKKHGIKEAIDRYSGFFSSTAFNGMNSKKQICAVDKTPGDEGQADTCWGDSGGPMMCGEEPKVLTGLTSWGFGCAEAPAIYTRVSAYISWIKKHAYI